MRLRSERFLTLSAENESVKTRLWEYNVFELKYWQRTKERKNEIFISHLAYGRSDGDLLLALYWRSA